MATQQDKGGVPFSIAHDMRQFRLLELPPEIVEMLDSPTPPPLSIKSQPPSNAPDAKPAYAVLCTPDKTFQLRQVQTSNTLFVTQPVFEAHGNETPAPATCAIASCTATLELLPSAGSAANLLQEILPVYDIIDGEVDAVSNEKSKLRVFEDLPFSSAQCQAGWIETVAFEFNGSSYRPSASALLVVWKSINDAALAEGIRLDQPFLINDLLKTVADDAHPQDLTAAILRHLTTEDANIATQRSGLDRARTVVFVGKVVLEARGGNGLLIADFTDAWDELLPEAWRKDAVLSKIENICVFPTKTTIRNKSKNVEASTISDAKVSLKPSARKWHEKFGKTRQK